MSRSTLPRGMRALLLVAGLGVVQACSEEPSAPAGSIVVTLAPATGSVAQGGSTTNTVTVVGSGGFVTTPTITVTGAPAGVTSSVSNVATSSGTSTATVTLNASQTTTPGVYPLSIVASGPGVSAKAATYALTVTGGSFATAFTPAALSVAQGASGTSTIAITRNNLAAAIGLAVTGMPAGVTATLLPTSTSGTASTLTVTAASTAALGTVNLVLTGTAVGAASQTSNLALTITAPPGSVGLTLTPASLSIAPGANASTTIALARTNFTGDATITAANLPAGVTAVFVPATTNGAASTMTITAGAAAVPGTYNLTIRATGTGITDATWDPLESTCRHASLSIL